MFRKHRLLLIGISALCVTGLLLPLVISSLGMADGTDISNIPVSADQTYPKIMNAPTENVSVEYLTRNYQIQEFGLISIQDQFQIHNNRTSPLMTFDICLTDFEANHLAYYIAESVSGSSMAIYLLPELLNGYKTLQIAFNQPITPFTTFNFTVKMIFYDLFIYNPDSNGYQLNGMVIPILPYVISGYQTDFKLPTGSTQINFNPGGTADTTTKVFSTQNDIAPFEVLNTYCTYTNSQTAILKLENVNRWVEINPLGYLRITEEHWLKSYSKPTINSFSIRLPGDVKSVEVKDDLGKISDTALASTVNNDGSKNLTFTLFGTATSNRATIRYNSIFYYKIVYYLPLENYYTYSLTKNSFLLDMFTTKADFIILNQTTNIVLIGGATVHRMNSIIQGQERNTNGVVLTFFGKYITPLHSEQIDLEYSINPFALFSRALLYSLVSIGVLGFYVFLKSVSKQETGEDALIEKTIPISELRQFVTLYEEKNALQLDIEKADEDLIRRKIQKKAYNKTIKGYSDKIKSIDEELKPFKKMLMESIDKIVKIVQSLDYLEAERISVKDSVTLLQDRYKKGKLPSRAAYERLSSDLIKRIEDIQKKIDRNINELRAYLI
jgi:hypothetical protein